MTTASASRTVIIEGLSKRAPHLRTYFELLLPEPTYTVEALNTIFRYEIIRNAPATVSTMEEREWLCGYPDVGQWVRFVSKHVVPLMVRLLDGTN